MKRIRPRPRWDDLALGARERKALRALVDRVRASGRGEAALFTGRGGTGKILAAEVIAQELGVDLLCVDLSRVVSKYIGETEKNLRAVFDEAEASGAVLLFEEADAVFGKRGEAGDRNDRFANIEVAWLLERIEAHPGLVILATNLRRDIDPAFLRRMRFTVNVTA